MPRAEYILKQYNLTQNLIYHRLFVTLNCCEIGALHLNKFIMSLCLGYNMLVYRVCMFGLSSNL